MKYDECLREVLYDLYLYGKNDGYEKIAKNNIDDIIIMIKELNLRYSEEIKNPFTRKMLKHTSYKIGKTKGRKK